MNAGRPGAVEDWQHACELRQALDESVERFKASGQLEIVIGNPPMPRPARRPSKSSRSDIRGQQ
jgi:hypothetical protein